MHTPTAYLGNGGQSLALAMLALVRCVRHQASNTFLQLAVQLQMSSSRYRPVLFYDTAFKLHILISPFVHLYLIQVAGAVLVSQIVFHFAFAHRR